MRCGKDKMKNLEGLLEKHLGQEVIIKSDFKDYTSKERKKGEKANVYEGHTYGLVRSNETALIFDRKYPFVAVPNEYFEIGKKKS